MKQNVQALRQSFTRSNSTPSKAKPQSAEIVVAQRERGAHVRRQLPHEAERAGVAAKLHAIEQHAFEGEAPILPLLALELDHTALSVKVDVANLDDVAISQPPPIDDVAQGAPVDARQIAAGLEPRIVGRRRGRHLHDTRPRTGLEMVA